MMQAMQHVFQQAAAAKPSILFIDELDSLPPRAATREHRDWYIGAVNALLELLDGGRRREGVVAIGACNDPERLDPALVRPGRMDRVITMELPSIEEITDILAFHAGGSIERAELGRIAVLATGSSGAQIEAVVREARREARHANREMTTADLWAAVTGSDKVLPADLVRRTAVHEAGHAFAAIHLGIARTVSVSIVRRGESLGATRIERVLQSQTRLVIEREIAVNLAGRAAEDVILGSVSSGAGGGEDSDLARATGAAVRMVAAYGLSETAGLVWHGPALMEQMVLAQPQLAAEVRTILDRCYGVACDLVRRERPAFERLVDGLIDRRGLAHAEIVALIGTPPVNG
jgi:ATP-dependent Zn protease